MSLDIHLIDDHLFKKWGLPRNERKALVRAFALKNMPWPMPRENFESPYKEFQEQLDSFKGDIEEEIAKYYE